MFEVYGMLLTEENKMMIADGEDVFNVVFSEVLNSARVLSATDIILSPFDDGRGCLVNVSERIGRVHVKLIESEFKMLNDFLSLDGFPLERVDISGYGYLTKFKPIEFECDGKEPTDRVLKILVLHTSGHTLIRVIGWDDACKPLDSVNLSDYDIDGAMEYLERNINSVPKYIKLSI